MIRLYDILITGTVYVRLAAEWAGRVLSDRRTTIALRRWDGSWDA